MTRFRVEPEAEPGFVVAARAASDFYATRPGCEASDPVSYTHLDVYKRQAKYYTEAQIGS